MIYGVIGAALLLGSVWFSPWTFGIFFAAVQAVMLWEFYRMMRAGGYAPATGIGLVGSLFIFVAVGVMQHTVPAVSGASAGLTPTLPGWNTALWVTPKAWLLPALVLPLLLILRELRRWPRHGQPFINFSVTLGGLFYVSIPMALLVVIAHVNQHYDYRRVFALLFLIWASDIGAYAAGKNFGKHKLAPSISPGKTWEGWAGGFLLTLLVGWALGLLLPDVPLAHRLVAAGVVAVFAPLGDLAESVLKRSVSVKDSGTIMPGHGGLLDRFDAFLLVLPVLALLQLLAG